VPRGLRLIFTGMLGCIIADGFSQQVAFTLGFERAQIGFRNFG
jgi:hypothetical protein